MSERPFNAGEPLTYFTTYGTWLAGDERGWQRWGEAGIQPPNKLFEQMAATDMKESTFTLSARDRRIVEVTMRRHCKIRGWTLHAVNARSNHVHVVVTSPGYEPDVVRNQFKAWCTRHLKPGNPGRERFWTEGASCRWINHSDDLESAVLYTTDSQDRKGRD